MPTIKAKDKHDVRAKYPDAQIWSIERQGTQRIVSPSLALPLQAAPAIGVGNSVAEAWADAARNVRRPPIPPLPPTGSATWSLKSDEPYWKGKDHAKAIR